MKLATRKELETTAMRRRRNNKALLRDALFLYASEGHFVRFDELTEAEQTRYFDRVVIIRKRMKDQQSCKP